MTAGDVMAVAAALLNDAAQDMWTNEKLLPYMKMAYNDLLLRLVANGLSIVDTIVTNLEVLANGTSLNFPSDCVDPIKLEERLQGSSDDWEKIDKVNELPQRDKDTELLEYNIKGEVFYFVGATTRRQIRLTYRKLLTELSGTGSAIQLEEAKQGLAEICAAYAATFGNNNPTRGRALMLTGSEKITMLIGNLVKQDQDMPVRRLPFRG